jgi:hypothetical protein
VGNRSPACEASPPAGKAATGSEALEAAARIALPPRPGRVDELDAGHVNLGVALLNQAADLIRDHSEPVAARRNDADPFRRPPRLIGCQSAPCSWTKWKDAPTWNTGRCDAPCRETPEICEGGGGGVGPRRLVSAISLGRAGDGSAGGSVRPSQRRLGRVLQRRGGTRPEGAGDVGRTIRLRRKCRRSRHRAGARQPEQSRAADPEQGADEWSASAR